MERIKNVKADNLEFVHQCDYESEHGLGERALYFIYDKNIDKRVCEILIGISDDGSSLWIGDMDCSNYITGEEHYGKGYGTKIINHFKEEFKIIEGRYIESSKLFWLKQDATLNEFSSKFSITKGE